MKIIYSPLYFELYQELEQVNLTNFHMMNEKESCQINSQYKRYTSGLY